MKEIIVIIIIFTGFMGAVVLTEYTTRQNLIKDIRLAHDVKSCVECHEEWGIKK